MIRLVWSNPSPPTWTRCHWRYCVHLWTLPDGVAVLGLVLADPDFRRPPWR